MRPVRSFTIGSMEAEDFMDTDRITVVPSCHVSRSFFESKIRLSTLMRVL
jgi:hypothetical protein